MRKVISLLAILTAGSLTGGAVSINELENQKALYEKAAAESQVRADWLQGKIDSVSEVKRALDEEAAVVIADYDKKKSALDETLNRIEANELKLLENERDYEKKRRQLEKRVRDIYINGQISYIDVIFGAQDFGDFLTRMDLLKHVLVNDSELVTSALEQKNELDALSVKLAQDKALQAEQARFAEKAKAAKEKKVAEQQRLIDRMETDKTFYNQRYDEMMAASKEVEKLIQDSKYKAAAEQVAKEQAVAERAAKAEREKIAREQRAAQERAAKEERAMRERLAREEMAMQERLAKEELATQKRVAQAEYSTQQLLARERREIQQQIAREKREAQLREERLQQQEARDLKAAQQQEARERRQEQLREDKEKRLEQQQLAREKREAQLREDRERREAQLREDRENRAAQLQAEREARLAQRGQLAHENMYGDSFKRNEDDEVFIPEGSGEMRWPLIGPITSEFGWRTHPIFGGSRFHSGIDIGGEYGMEIKAARGGIVTHSGWIDGYGNTVMIDHGGGIVTLYGHNQSLAVAVGQKVRQGQVIAYCGSTGNSTGPHCHFEVRKNGQPVSPFDYL